MRLIILMLLLMSISVEAFNIEGGGVCNCADCDDCELALNDMTDCSVKVKLANNITNITGTCIDNPINLTNKIFDCEMKSLTGNNMTGEDTETGLVLYYHFNNNSYFGENDSHVYDFSISGNNGTITNAVFTTGKYKSGMLFDGSGDTITVTNQTNLNPALTDKITVSTWVKFNSITGTQVIAERWCSGDVSWLLMLDSGIIKFELRDDSSANYEVVSGTLTTGQWYHILATSDGVTPVKLYINGMLNGSSGGICTSIIAPTNPLYLGSDCGNSLYLNGILDEVKIYNKSLSSAEVYSDFVGSSGIYINNASNISVNNCNISNFTNAIVIGSNSTSITVIPMEHTITLSTDWERETSFFMNGSTCIKFQREPAGTLSMLNATDSNCTVWNDMGTVLTNVVFAHASKHNDTYYLVANAPWNSSLPFPENLDIYMWNSSNGSVWNIMNGGNPVLLTEPSGQWYQITNPELFFINETIHLIAECASNTAYTDVKLCYAYSNFTELNFTNHKVGTMIDWGGSSDTIYIQNRTSIVGIFHYIPAGAATGYWSFNAWYVNISENLSNSSNWHVSTNFNISVAGVHITDPGLLYTNNTKDYSFIVEYCEAQHIMKQTFTNLSLDDFYDALLPNSTTLDNYYPHLKVNATNVSNNNLSNNNYGILMSKYVANSSLNNNRMCSNIIDLIDFDSNSGDGNTCNIFYNWNDTGTTGCTYSCTAGTCFCSSCDDCEDKLDNASCTTVKLNTNITNQIGMCIDTPMNYNNKIFDCQGYTIDGDDSGADVGFWVNAKENNTIKNCIITDFYFGIYLYNSTNNTILNNTANSNIYGIDLTFWSNKNNITNNTANLNTNGIVLYQWSNNNTLTNNTANGNTVFGIFLNNVSSNNLTLNTAKFNNKEGIKLLIGSIGNILNNNTFCDNNQFGGAYYDITNQDINTGDNNTCNTSSNWNDTGTLGCSFTCTELTDIETEDSKIVYNNIFNKYIGELSIPMKSIFLILPSTTLSINETADSNCAWYGMPIKFTYSTTNTGNVDVNVSCYYNDGDFSYSLLVNETKTYYSYLTFNDTFTNVLTCTSCFTDGTCSINSVNYTVQLANVSINKTTNKAVYTSNEIINYTINVTNNGDCNLTNLIISDKINNDIPVNFTASIIVNNSYITNILYSVNITDVQREYVFNNVSVLQNGSAFNYTSINPIVFLLNTTVIPSMKVNITKTVNNASVYRNAVVKFNFSVLNFGDVPVTCSLNDSDVWNIYSYDNIGKYNENWKYNKFLTGYHDFILDINQTKIFFASRGIISTLTNNANINCSFKNVTVLNSSSVSVFVCHLTVIKNVNQTNVSQGRTITYNITVINDGDCNMTDVIAIDSFDVTIPKLNISTGETKHCIYNYSFTNPELITNCTWS